MQILVAKKLAYLKRNYLNNPEHWSFEYERLKDDSMKEIAFFKLALTSGNRMIFFLDGANVVLCDLGDHDVMQSFSSTPSSVRKLDISQALPISDELRAKIDFLVTQKNKINLITPDTHPSSKLEELVSQGAERWLFEEELDERWVTYLDDEQFRISKEITNLLVSGDGSFRVLLLMGGPGTGKTTILQNLSENLANRGLSVSFQISEPVRKYLGSGKASMFGVNIGLVEGSILLIDDPETSRHLVADIRKGKSLGVKSIVVAGDPLQWLEKQSFEDFIKIQRKYPTETFVLWTCYRQTKSVGMAALNITQNLFASALRSFNGFEDPYLDFLRKYSDLSTGMDFVDSEGEFQVFLNFQHTDVTLALQKLRNRYDRWQHFHPLCVVYEKSSPREFKDLIRKESYGLNRRDILFDEIVKVRGQEFQEMFIFISKQTWSKISSIHSSTSKDDLQLALKFHIALTRPKDKLNLFVY